LLLGPFGFLRFPTLCFFLDPTHHVLYGEALGFFHRPASFILSSTPLRLFGGSKAGSLVGAPLRSLLGSAPGLFYGQAFDFLVRPTSRLDQRAVLSLCFSELLGLLCPSLGLFIGVSLGIVDCLLAGLFVGAAFRLFRGPPFRFFRRSASCLFFLGSTRGFVLGSSLGFVLGAALGLFYCQASTFFVRPTSRLDQRSVFSLRFSQVLRLLCDASLGLLIGPSFGFDLLLLLEGFVGPAFRLFFLSPALHLFVRASSGFFRFAP
jgi:hypothetical protein